MDNFKWTRRELFKLTAGAAACLTTTRWAVGGDAGLSTGQRAKLSAVGEKLSALADPAAGVFVVPHRGMWREAPENSLQGIQLCIDSGCPMVEIDVRETSDGQYVLMHDKTLSRMTDTDGVISEMTLKQVRNVKLKDHTGRVTEHEVPTLLEAVELAKGKTLLYLDKTEDMIDQVQVVLEKAGLADGVVYYGRRTVAEFRTRYPDLLGRIVYLPKVGEGTAQPELYVKRWIEASKPPAFVYDFATEASAVLSTLAVVKNAGCRVWMSPLWETLAAGRTDDLALAAPAENWGWLLEHGASMLCTDRPRELISYLRSKQYLLA